MYSIVNVICVIRNTVCNVNFFILACSGLRLFLFFVVVVFLSITVVEQML